MDFTRILKNQPCLDNTGVFSTPSNVGFPGDLHISFIFSTFICCSSQTIYSIHMGGTVSQHFDNYETGSFIFVFT